MFLYGAHDALCLYSIITTKNLYVPLTIASNIEDASNRKLI